MATGDLTAPPQGPEEPVEHLALTRAPALQKRFLDHKSIWDAKDLVPLLHELEPDKTAAEHRIATHREGLTKIPEWRLGKMQLILDTVREEDQIIAFRDAWNDWYDRFEKQIIEQIGELQEIVNEVEQIRREVEKQFKPTK